MSNSYRRTKRKLMWYNMTLCVKGNFKLAEDDTIIWRYMDTERFIGLLDKLALFFTFPNYFNDPEEGTLTLWQREVIKEKLSSLYKGDEQYNIGEALEGEANNILKIIIGANCWHANNYESEAMWRLYCDSGKGIAICSTVKRLKECITDTERDIIIGEVAYIDYAKEKIKRSGIIDSFFYKRRSFSHENEIRAVVDRSINYSEELHSIYV